MVPQNTHQKSDPKNPASNKTVKWTKEQSETDDQKQKGGLGLKSSSISHTDHEEGDTVGPKGAKGKQPTIDEIEEEKNKRPKGEGSKNSS
ncbi:MAG: hypothetical protein EOP04_24330 [Proteobacteria bacterium]|nr:MAG: hypothetical protein EOP04_24330 [Pseudomonadota bacterium]